MLISTPCFTEKAKELQEVVHSMAKIRTEVIILTQACFRRKSIVFADPISIAFFLEGTKTR